jgi:hypothetical protein
MIIAEAAFRGLILGGIEMNKKAIIIGLAGGLGGISPLLMRWANALQGSRELPLLGGCILSLLIFFVLGAVIVLVFGEVDTKKAFLLGVGLPALLNIQGSETGQVNSGHAGILNKSVFFVSSLCESTAYALESPGPNQPGPAGATGNVRIPGRHIEILEDPNKPVDVEFLDKEARAISIVSPSTGEKRDWLPVPENAMSVRFSKNGKASAPFVLPSKLGAARQYEVSTMGQKTMTFRSIFSGAPDWAVRFEVKQKDVPRVASGVEGWLCLGSVGSDPNQHVSSVIRGKKLTDLQKGDIVQVYGPIDVTSDASKTGVRIGIVGTEQPIEINDIVTAGDVLWLKVKAR